MVEYIDYLPTVLETLIGKEVILKVSDELAITGKLTNHKEHLYQVTESSEKYFVFWDREILNIIDNRLYHMHSY